MEFFKVTISKQLDFFLDMHLYLCVLWFLWIWDMGLTLDNLNLLSVIAM